MVFLNLQDSNASHKKLNGTHNLLGANHEFPQSYPAQRKNWETRKMTMKLMEKEDDKDTERESRWYRRREKEDEGKKNREKRQVMKERRLAGSGTHSAEAVEEQEEVTEVVRASWSSPGVWAGISCLARDCADRPCRHTRTCQNNIYFFTHKKYGRKCFVFVNFWYV